MPKKKYKSGGKCPRCGKNVANCFVALDNETAKKLKKSHAEVCFDCAVKLDSR